MAFENVSISLMRAQPSLECGSDAAALVCIKLFNSHKPCSLRLKELYYESLRVFRGLTKAAATLPHSKELAVLAQIEGTVLRKFEGIRGFNQGGSVAAALQGARGARSDSLTLFSPAKINLFLRILGKRSDGYHEIASLFQAITLGDTLTFTPSKEDSLTTSDPTLKYDSSNLINKALALFRRKTNLSTPIAIHLEKRIPMQAGLGGGSSNAATTLSALNTLHNHPFTIEELQLLSAELGSDVPFFFSSGTAYCTGRGEIVKDLPPLPLPTFSIIKPKEGLSTPAIFKELKVEECSSQDPEELLESFYAKKPIFVNDLEGPAFRLCPPLGFLKQELAAQAPVFMTGSGTALVALDNNC